MATPAALAAAAMRRRAGSISHPRRVGSGGIQGAQRGARRERGRRVNSKALAVGFGREMPVAARTIALSDVDVGRRRRRRALRADRSPFAERRRASRGDAAAGDRIPISPCVSRVRAPAPRSSGPFPRNAIAEDTARFGQFWSPVLEGDVATIEFHAGPVLPSTALTLTLPRVAHQVVGDAELRVAVREDGHRNRSGAELQHRRRLRHAHGSAVRRERKRWRSCCSSTTTAAQYLCTGTLLNDGADDQHALPVHRGALHEARRRPRIRSTRSGSSTRSRASSNAVPPYVQLTGGAALLGRSQDHDWALVRLERIAARMASGSPHGTRTRFRSHAVDHDAASPAWAISRNGREGYVGQSVSLSDEVVHGDVQRGALHQRDHRGRFERCGTADLSRFRRLLRGARRLSPKAISSTCPAAPGAVFDDYSRVEDMLPLVRQYLTPARPIPRAGRRRRVSTTGHSTIIS